MRKLTTILFITLLLLIFVFFLYQFLLLELNDAIALVALIGVAAALAALILSSPKPARFSISDGWLEIREAAYEYKVRFTLINTGDKEDVLENIDHLFYKRGFGVTRSVLVCGAREITSETGHILPFPLKPKVATVLEGWGNVLAKMRYMEAIEAKDQWELFVLRCTLRFSDSKPHTIWLSVGGPGNLKRNRFLTSLEEFFLRIKTKIIMFKILKQIRDK